MSAQIYLVTLVVLAGTCILIFGLRYMASRQSAATVASKEAAYRDFVAKATATQSEAISKLAALQDEVAAASSRLAAIEKLLRDVG